MSRGNSSDEDSRTNTITTGIKHARTNTDLLCSPMKRRKHRHRAGYQDLRDLVPRGGSFGWPAIAEPKSQIFAGLPYAVDQGPHDSGSSSDYQIPQTSPSTSAMSWNNSAQGSIRTSLQGGGNLGQNRLATGFRAQPDGNVNGEVPPYEVVEISDDSEMEDDSGEGILLNVDVHSRVGSSVDAETPVEIAANDDGENAEKPPNKAMPSGGNARVEQPPLAFKSSGSVTLQTSPREKPDATPPMFQIDASGGGRILADLNPDDLEKQIKYTLFHLPRDQIDLSRPAICIACLVEGHTDEVCPRLLCPSCGCHTKHPTRLCPKRTRCAKCGDRGHNADACKSKLRNPNLEPCDFCGGGDHVEASCNERFFPARTELPGDELQLWISCAQCGSKEHLAGDCPAYGSRPAHAWSLRGYSRYNIVNLSLQTGGQAREKEAQSRGIRPEGMKIKGRGAPSNNKYPKRGRPAEFSGLQSEDDDDFTTRLAGNRSRGPSPPRNHIRFGDNDYYRPGPSNGYDRSHWPSSSEYRDRDGYREGRGYREDRDHHNRRPRSRSPPRFDGDSWRPPLPRGPPPPASLPARPAPRRGQQQQQPQTRNKNSSKKSRRGDGKARGAGAAAVKPMPSSAQNAWNKGRT